ncbi:ribosomal RNA small subunit methyltransferase H [Alicyclobacillus sacchari]|nr:ribosomal RNA small subunit methyltransferase H [Alicyclobacillus sacchari]
MSTQRLAGGHTRLLLERSSPGGRVIAMDQDETAIRNAAALVADYPGRLTLLQANFADIAERLPNLGVTEIDGAMFDLGVSSPQFDVPERGFSYWHEGPLDMRMDRTAELTAEDVVNHWTQAELARILREYGEERFAGAIARRIVEARSVRPIATTTELAEIVKAAIPAPARRKGPHPARRTFQAIRIAVNDELGVLERGLKGAFSLLRAGGRLAVISFHSLEDRIVKQMFKELATGCICPPELPVCQCGREPKGRLVTRKPVAPADVEVHENARARSAKLRVIEKL